MKNRPADSAGNAVPAEPSLDAPLRLDAGGHELLLLAQRAVWWPAERTLLLADLHLGKGALFRAHGQPVPQGESQRTLDAWGALIARFGARRSIVLGDLLHGRDGLTPALDDAVRRWRLSHQATQVDWLPGNHDARLQRVAAQWHMRLLPSLAPLAPGLSACHEPPAAAPPDFIVCGHLHPAVTVRVAADRVRVPCFVARPRSLLLPAFGSWTGSAELSSAQLDEPGTRLALVAGDRLVWAPVTGAGTRAQPQAKLAGRRAQAGNGRGIEEV